MGVPGGCVSGRDLAESKEPSDCGGQLARICPCGGPSGCALGEVWPKWRARRKKTEGRKQI